MPRADAPDGRFDEVQIPVGGRFWRALGGNGALVVGYALAAGYLGVLAAGSTSSLGGEGDAVPSGLFVATAVLPLLAAVFLWIGELVRRGRWGGPSGHKPDALLPQGSTTVRVRLLPLGWHVVWLFAAGGVAGLLLVGVTRETLAGSGTEGRAMWWTVHGVLLAAITGAVAGSFVKKLAWSRRRPRPAASAHPALERRKTTATAGRTFWRWFGYRWRFDLWCCALGATAAWATGWVLAQRPAFPDEAASITTAAAWLGIVAAVLLGGGLVATTQFWRAGEDLAGAESVA